MTKDRVGLSESEVVSSREKYGDNSLAKQKTKGIVRKFFENLNDPIIKVLILALLIEVIFTFRNCNFFEIGGIIFAILIATTVSTLSEYGSERAFLKMQAEYLNTTARVMRCGEILEIPVAELVVGDIVYLSGGEKINADGEIISGSLKVDQSALNGESRDVTKIPCKTNGKFDLQNKCKVFRGSVIISGEGIMRVERVGVNTYYGMVAKDVQSETRESPLKLRLSKFAGQISKIGYVMASVVALAYLFNTFVADNGFITERILSSFKNIPFLISTLTHALTLMITVIVVAAPEGLPMMITVVLSANMKKMMRDNVLVKKLVGIETAGSMNILFTDKTGTLTTGALECDKIISPYARYKSISALKKDKRLYEIMCVTALLNTETTIGSGGIVGGNSTERALAKFFKDSRVDRLEVKHKIPFSSEKKLSLVSFKNGFTYIKGAPEIILSLSGVALSECGERVPIDKREIENAYINEASEGNRVIGVAYRERDGEELIFAALVVLKDKIRRGVRESVRGVRGAGVEVVMVTGDGKETAAAIARECGIMDGNSSEIVITSSELSAMSDSEVKKIIPNLRVLARALPQDKTRLVRLSQELDLVVGMTGDGINDAPSLKLADVGFAMGNGADIAKGAGDIIILDNSFFAINRTILYGRTIFKSIRKFITFQLIMNFVACGVSLFGQFLGIDSPITIIQMLWVNIIMDTLGGLAFAGEPPLEYYMREKPKKRDEPILTKDMLHKIFFDGIYTLAVCILFLKGFIFSGAFRMSDGGEVLLTAFYALFIFSGIFICFGARCERLYILSSIEKNKAFIFIMLSISVIQILMIYLGGSLFRCVPLTAKELLCVVSIAFTTVIFEIIRRVLYKLK